MSTVVRLTPKVDPGADIVDPALLSSLVALAFSRRRKTLRNALNDRASAQDLEAVGIDPDLRAERVAIETWVALANHLAGAR